MLGEQGRHLQPLLHPLHALLPLAGQPADRPLRPQQQRPRQRPARTAAAPASRPASPTRHNLATWLQGAGYRTIHIGKFLNGYGDAPYSPGTEVPPGWSAWHTILNSDTDHYSYGYMLNNNGVGRRALTATPAAGKRANTANATTPAAPTRRSTANPASTRPTSSTGSPAKRLRGDARRNSPSTCSSTTPRRTATSADRPGREPATRHYDRFAGAPLPAQPRRRLQRGQRQRQAPLHPRSALPLADRNPHLPRLLPERPGVAALGRRRRQTDRRHARRACTGCATPTSSSPPTTASSTASTASSAASSSPTSPRPTCRC